MVLALDLRHRRLGYAAFLGRQTLLEWGQRYYPAVGDVEREIAQKRISRLLTGIGPDLILLKQERWDRAHRDHHLANPLAALQNEAAKRSVPIRLIPENIIRSAFAVFGCRTRSEIATTIGSLFPELLRSIPPVRKMWQAEHGRRHRAVLEPESKAVRSLEHSSRRYVVNSVRWLYHFVRHSRIAAVVLVLALLALGAYCVFASILFNSGGDRRRKDDGIMAEGVVLAQVESVQMIWLLLA